MRHLGVRVGAASARATHDARWAFGYRIARPTMTLDDLDPATWRPRDVATLLFVIRDGEALLIRKKRGLGAGKINAPGGRLEPGETPPECAVREVREELGVTPTGVRARGELRFQFADGYGLHCHVFTADGCEGEAVETDEAVPRWTPLDAIPYDEMWADDALWLPVMLSGRGFSGRFLFDGDRMLAHALTVFDLTP
jgi:8-oxo-dGTP diphosphatase